MEVPDSVVVTPSKVDVAPTVVSVVVFLVVEGSVAKNVANKSRSKSSNPDPNVAVSGPSQDIPDGNFVVSDPVSFASFEVVLISEGIIFSPPAILVVDGPNVVFVVPPLVLTVLSDPIFGPLSVNFVPLCAVMDVPDLVVINPPVLIVAPGFGVSNLVDFLPAIVVVDPEAVMAVMAVPPAVDVFDLGVVLSAIVVVDSEFVVAFSPTIAELSSGLGIVVATFLVKFLVVVTTSVFPFVIISFLVDFFPVGAFSVD